MQNWLDNLDHASWDANNIYLLKKRKEELSLIVIEDLRSTLNMEREMGLVKCSCNDNFSCNRMTYLSILDFNKQLGQKQLELRGIRKKNVIAGINTDLQMIPAYKIAMPIYWQDRVDAAKTIQKYWRKFINQNITLAKLQKSF